MRPVRQLASRFGLSAPPGAAAAPIIPSTSHARVKSPEGPPGLAYDHAKWSASTRWARTSGRAREYALAEWAVTHETYSGRPAFRFTSMLAEALMERSGVAVAVRAERTTRPEEERLVDPFRTLRPPHDLKILGITRWDIGTLAVSAPGVGRWLGLRGVAGAPEPFLEVARLRAKQVIRPSMFEPALFFGAERMSTLTAGLRVHLGAAHRRMGQYGAARRAAPAHVDHAIHEH